MGFLVKVWAALRSKPARAVLALALLGSGAALADGVPASQLQVVAYHPLSKALVAGSPVGKPLYDYVYAVEARNSGAAIADASATATSTRKSVQLITAEVRFGAFAAARNQTARDFLKVRAGCFFDLRLDPKDAAGKTKLCKAGDAPGEDDEADGYGFGLPAATVKQHYFDKFSTILDWRTLVRATGAPKIAATLPVGLINLSRPTIAAALTDGGGGVDPAKATLVVDGVDVTLHSTITATGVSYVPAAALADGTHQVRLSVPDRAGNMAHGSWHFVSDATAPVISGQFPQADSFLPGGSAPRIAASFADPVSGLDGATVLLLLDGVDVTSRAVVSAGSIAMQVPAPLADGSHSVKLRVADRAGNVATGEWAFGVASAPLIKSVSPRDVALPFNSAPPIVVQYEDPRVGVDTSTVLLLLDGVDVTAQSQVGATGVTYTPPAPLAAGPHTAVISLSNKINASAQLSWGFDIDEGKTYNLAIVSPANASVTPDAQTEVKVTAGATGTGVATVVVNGAPMQHSADGVQNHYVGRVALQPGSNTLTVTATYEDGQIRSETVAVTYDAPPVVTITSPKDRATLGAIGANSPRDLTGNVERPVTVTGTTNSPMVSVTINQQQATVTGTSFRFDNFFLHEGTNQLVAVATDARGRVGTAAVTVSVDQTAPMLAIESPANHSVTSGNTIDVRGTVNDAVEGYYGAPEPAVQVTGAAGGTSAKVGDKAFFAAAVPLVLGSNVISVDATDQAGNVRKAQITVSRVAAGGQRLAIAGGNAQEAAPGMPVAAPLTVSALDASGAPLVDIAVTFDVTRGTGRLAASKEALAGGAPVRHLQVRTDANGTASAWMMAGMQSGPASNAVRASAPNIAEDVSFAITGTKGAPRHIRADLGINQFVATGAEPIEALTAVLMDDHENRIAGAPVTFSVLSGDVFFKGVDGAPAKAITVNTDKNGYAAVRPTMGAKPGLAIVTALPATGGDQFAPATFTLQALKATDGPTGFIGTVTNDKGQALPGATISIGRTALSTTVDDKGQFRFDDIPPGKIDLFVDGRTVNLQGQQYPALHFEAMAVKGVRNQLVHPIYLPQLQMAQAKIVGGNQDVVLKMPGIEGYEMTVFANSVTFPDGSKVGPLVVSPISFDKLPMTPPGGYAGFMAPAGTIQPSGTRFDPPVRLKVPNTAGFAPGQRRPVYQWDHDLATFVEMGQATVSEDGAFLVTEPGTGISKAGWHPIPNPPPPDKCPQGGEMKCDECEKESSVASKCPRRFCEFDKSKDGKIIPPSVSLAAEREFEFGKSSMMKFLSKLGLPDTKVKAKYGVQGNIEQACCGKTESKEKVLALPSILGALEMEAEGGIPRFSIKNDFVKAGIFVKVKVIASGALSYRRNFCNEDRGKLVGSVAGGVTVEAALKFDQGPATGGELVKVNLIDLGGGGFATYAWGGGQRKASIVLTVFLKSEVTFGSRKYVLWNSQSKWDHFTTESDGGDTSAFDSVAAGTN